MDRSLSLFVTLKMYMRVLSIYLIFLDINNLVSGLCIFVFHIDSLRARLGVVIYAFYPFFHQKITSACKNHTSPVNRKSTDLALWLKT